VAACVRLLWYRFQSLAAAKWVVVAGSRRAADILQSLCYCGQFLAWTSCCRHPTVIVLLWAVCGVAVMLPTRALSAKRVSNLDGQLGVVAFKRELREACYIGNVPVGAALLSHGAIRGFSGLGGVKS